VCCVDEIGNLVLANACMSELWWRNLFKVGGHKCTLKMYGKFFSLSDLR